MLSSERLVGEKTLCLMRAANQFKKVVFLLFSLYFIEGYAKELKLSKNIVFVGEVIKKIPSGKGLIKCLDPKDKETPSLTIEGTFAYGKITDAVLKTKGFDGFAITGSFEYSVETDGEKNQLLYIHSTYNSKVEYSHNDISVNNATYTSIPINDIYVLFRFDKKGKVWDYHLIDASKAIQESIVQTIELPGVKCPSELSPFGYKYSNIYQSLCPIIISKKGLTQNGAITYIFRNSDEYCDGELKFFNSQGLYNIGEDGWDGYREFSSAVVKKKSKAENVISIEYKNGDLFEGVINNTADIRSLLGYNADFSKIKLWEGTGRYDGKSEKWIKGETLTQRHRRLSEFLDQDLVLKVEQDSISEDQGRAEMERRKEERRKQEKKRIHERTIEEMNMYWGDNRQVLFEGEVEGEADTDNILRAMFGFDHTYFQGTALLTLDDAREGVFAFIVEPSQKAYAQGQGRATQVALFCRDEFTKKYNGKWEIRDNKIFIGGNECGTISNDGSTIKYKGMLSSTMKLSFKSTESAFKFE